MSQLIEKINKLEPKEHVIIGTILRKYPNVKLNENKGGVMVNISTVPEEALQEIEKYIEYVHTQKNVLDKIELQTKEYEQYLV
jgi:hypothetical protein